MDKFAPLLNGARSLAILCTQWGDTGKGKFVDAFADWADLVARGTGGANAGHTICADGRKFVFHLLPSGLLHGKLNVIGSGVAFDPRVALEEIAELRAAGYDPANLRIALNARLVLPQHLVMDRVREDALGKSKIGTTGRGMGPVYVDHYARVGLTVNDLLNPQIFREKLEQNLPKN